MLELSPPRRLVQTSSQQRQHRLAVAERALYRTQKSPTIPEDRPTNSSAPQARGLFDNRDLDVEVTWDHVTTESVARLEASPTSRRRRQLEILCRSVGMYLLGHVLESAPSNAPPLPQVSEITMKS